MAKKNEQQNFNQLRNDLAVVIKKFLDNNETYQRIQRYVQSANNNLEVIQKTLANINANYKKYELHEFCINNDAFMTSFSHEIELMYFNKEYIDSLPFKLNSFIKLLIDSGLKDEVLKIQTN